jgi:hypothetical protein
MWQVQQRVRDASGVEGWQGVPYRTGGSVPGVEEDGEEEEDCYAAPAPAPLQTGMGTGIICGRGGNNGLRRGHLCDGVPSRPRATFIKFPVRF